MISAGKIDRRALKVARDICQNAAERWDGPIQSDFKGHTPEEMAVIWGDAAEALRLVLAIKHWKPL